MERSMKSNLSSMTITTITTITKPIPRRLRLFLLATLFMLGCATLKADGGEERNRGANHYRQVNLVSDLAGVGAVQDTNLVNAWGLSFSPTGPFLVSANETGRAMGDFRTK